MHYLQNGSQVSPVPPTKPRTGTPGFFTESGVNNRPSYPGQDWFNAVIREFQGALSANGVAFDPEKYDHLTKLLKIPNDAIKELQDGKMNDKNGVSLFSNRQIQITTDYTLIAKVRALDLVSQVRLLIGGTAGGFVTANSWDITCNHNNNIFSNGSFGGFSPIQLRAYYAVNGDIDIFVKSTSAFTARVSICSLNGCDCTLHSDNPASSFTAYKDYDSVIGALVTDRDFRAEKVYSGEEEVYSPSNPPPLGEFFELNVNDSNDLSPNQRYEIDIDSLPNGYRKDNIFVEAYLFNNSGFGIADYAEVTWIFNSQANASYGVHSSIVGNTIVVVTGSALLQAQDYASGRTFDKGNPTIISSKVKLKIWRLF